MDELDWLKQRDDPRVLEHLEAENRRTEDAMRHTEGLQAQLYRELVGRIQETDCSAPVRVDDYLYYHRTESGRQYPIWCRRRGNPEGIEEILLDANRLAEGLDFFRVGVYEPSPDHSYLAYSFDTNGAEAFTLVIKDLSTGELLPERFENTAYSLAWTNDSTGFLYTIRDGAHRPFEVYLHTLGRPASTDRLVHHEPDDAFFISVHRSRSRRFLLIELESAITSEVRYLDAGRPAAEPRIVKPRRSGIEYDVCHHGDSFYVRTNDGAKNFRLLRAPILDDGSQADEWTEVEPARDAVTLEAVDAFEGHLVLTERHGGLRRFVIRDLTTGDAHQVAMPEPVFSLSTGENPNYHTRSFRFLYASPVTPETTFDYDMVGRSSTVVKRQEVLGGYRPADYLTARLFADGEGGVRVPMTVVHRSGLDLDGSNPCLLTGYGAYGITLEPSFSAPILSLLDRGFVFAIAHVRGGGALGEEWHEDGRMLNKRTSFTDFIACAEHLVSQGFTSPSRLAIRGRSAGGLLMGAVANMRPDLFATVVAGVPFVDVLSTMLDPTIPLTVTEYEEWGDPRDPDYLRYIRSYSPVDNIQPKPYPNILATAGLHDTRVQYWEAARWVARLRAVKTDSKRLLLKTDLVSGHSGPSGRYDHLQELAFEYAFLLDTIGAEHERADPVSDPSPAAQPVET